MPGPLPTDQILALLGGAPPRIAVLTGGLQPAQLRAKPNPDDWSANDVLAHLRSCADVWGGNIATILEQDHPTIKAISPRTWIYKTDYLEQEFQPSLLAFTRQREELVAVLQAMTPAEWSRAARVTGAGKPLEWSVQFVAQRLAEHERAHIKQIGAIAGRVSR